MKMTIYMELSERQKENIVELNKKINDIKSLTKTLKYKASVEERNRIAARIHDQVGHGISGSIIMLEAAMLTMKEHPEKAEDSIKKAVLNLREGVDEIRTSLREERVDQYLIGKNDIATLLEEFQVTYNKSVEFRTNGDLNMISLEVWACIHDNTKECLTNLLKHSNATKFIISIDVFKKIIKVEYKDNGSDAKAFEKGLGLEAMEERTVNAKGRCFWSSTEQGFTVTNIFNY
jgi:signal transduction histidine kinase